MRGGEGDDRITGGAGESLILGGGGAYTLVGAAGNDLIIGGAGADRIGGASGHDILVSGSMGYSWTREAFRQSSRNWALGHDATDDGDDDGLGGLITDADFDRLTGGAGNDWCIIGEGDRITDSKSRSGADLVTAG